MKYLLLFLLVSCTVSKSDSDDSYADKRIKHIKRLKSKNFKSVVDCYNSEKENTPIFFRMSLLDRCEEALGYIDCNNFPCK